MSPRDEQPEATAGKRLVTARVTMTDVAAAAGCSQSTVSMVLNGGPEVRISAATRARIATAVTSLGYRHRASPVRRDGSVRQIAVIYDRLSGGLDFAAVVDGIREAAWSGGHLVSLFETRDEPQVADRTIAAVVRNRADAIIYAASVARQVALPESLLAAGMRVVLLNCQATGRQFSTVGPDEIGAGRRITEALLAAGHRRIAHITGEMWTDSARNRLRGYREGLEAAGIAHDGGLVREGNWSLGSGYWQTLALLDLGAPPTAIFCANDRMAVGCYEALKERRVRIPAEMSVVGCDDEDVALELAPALTTLALPYRALGRWVVEAALATTPAGGGQHAPALLEGVLVERQSVAPPRRTPLPLPAPLGNGGAFA